MTADNGRRGVAWYDRRHPNLVREAARRAGFRSTPHVGGDLVVSGAGVVLDAHFTMHGVMSRAAGRAATGEPVHFRARELGLTQRQLVDLVVAWLAAGRPAEIIPLIPSPFSTTDPEPLAEVLPFTPRSQQP